MKTKAIALMAVFAMAFAGFAVYAEATDADDAPAVPSAYLTIIYDGYITPDELVLLVGEDAFANPDNKFTISAQFDDSVEITIMNLDSYELIKDNIKKGVVSYDYATLAGLSEDDLADVLDALDLFTFAVIDEDGKFIGGITTTIKMKGLAQAKAVEVGAIDPTLVFTAEDLEKAVADAKAEFAGYVSPADAQAKADKAVEDYKAQHPVSNTEQIWMVLAIVALVGLVALGAFTVIKAVKAKKKRTVA